MYPENSNLNLTKSKRAYKMSFVIISNFFALFAGVFVADYIKTANSLKTDTIPIFLFGFIWIIWNTISIYLAKKIWPENESTSDKIIYDENFRKKVRDYRNLFWISLIITFLPVILLPLFPINSNIVSTSFFGGLLMLVGVMFYFSGAKSVSENEIIKYPFQFISDPVLRKEAVEKRIKFELVSTLLAVTALLILYGLGWLKIGYSGIFSLVAITPFALSYRRRLLRSVNS